jgi:2-polyprenyl-3-methyl-5-hydroxy-6-metoxy-1,4-benzoquinol methylase
MTDARYRDYGYHDSGEGWAHAYLMPTVEALVDEIRPRRVLEIGCGNGSTANRLARRGDLEVVAVELSESGIDQARANMDPRFPVQFEVASAYDDLGARFGRFDLVLSLEVIEHLYSPRVLVDRARDALTDGGHLILSTPFHGYLKNLALALSGKLDDHFTALWDGGHIKFWSERTLRALIEERGFTADRFVRCGRIAPLAKSMIIVGRREASA